MDFTLQPPATPFVAAMPQATTTLTGGTVVPPTPVDEAFQWEEVAHPCSR